MPSRLPLLISFPWCCAVAAAGEAEFLGRAFHFADGYQLELAAAPPLVTRPIEASFDRRGRLYVTESSGSNEPVAEQRKKQPHCVLRLEDTDGDGVFDHRTVFAEGLMFPEGILWHEDSVYVAAPPEIWKFTDFDDDGTADQREVWYDGKTLTGCANDLHGPYLGPDGLIYWCKGAFAEQTHDLPGKPGWKTRASHVFRCRPDGADFDCVFTAGMDNPVGVAWTPEGDLMVCGTFLQHPEAGKRDGIIHAVRCGVWGKDHEVLAGHARTGALMPAMTHLGPAAAAGMCRYGRDLLVCQFNLRTVSQHRLIPDGSSYHTEDSPLLSSNHPDFHPTDVLQAKDGSVLVIDTGGWYKLCCPTSQLAKPEVPGAIYRLRKLGGEVPIAAPPPQWKLERPGDFVSLTAQLRSENRHVRRLAMEELGQFPQRQPTPEDRLARSREIVKILAEAAANTQGDRFLEHAATYALLEGGDPGAMNDLLPHCPPLARRALLFALAQKSPGVAAPEMVAAFLGGADSGVLEALVFAFGKSPAWKQAAKKWLAENLNAIPPAQTAFLTESLVAAAPDLLPDLGRLLTNATDQALRRKLLAAMRMVSEKQPCPAAWIPAVLTALRSNDAAEGRAAAVFLSTAKLPADPPILARIAEVANDARQPEDLRLLMLSNPELTESAVKAFDFLLTQLNSQTVPEMRLSAARTISRLTLASQQFNVLAGLISHAGMLERPLLLNAFRNCSDESVGLKLAEQLESAGLVAGLPEGVLAEVLVKFPDKVKMRFAAALAKARTGRGEQEKRLTELEQKLAAGNAAQGSLVFQSAKASCVLCHKIGYKGGILGPDLSKVGAVRTRRDLLEAVVFPSASFVRSYEPVDVQRLDGSRISGIIHNQDGDSLTLHVGAAAPDVTMALRDVKALTQGQFSLMPAGFDVILTEVEMADLIAFLQSMK